MKKNADNSGDFDISGSVLYKFGYRFIVNRRLALTPQIGAGYNYMYSSQHSKEYQSALFSIGGKMLIALSKRSQFHVSAQYEFSRNMPDDTIESFKRQARCYKSNQNNRFWFLFPQIINE